MATFNEIIKGMKAKEKLTEELDKDIKDEKEAVEGYDKTIKAASGNAKRQLGKIREEEVAHKDYLERAKKDPDAKYE